MQRLGLASHTLLHLDTGKAPALATAVVVQQVTEERNSSFSRCTGVNLWPKFYTEDMQIQEIPKCFFHLFLFTLGDRILFAHFISNVWVKLNISKLTSELQFLHHTLPPWFHEGKTNLCLILNHHELLQYYRWIRIGFVINNILQHVYFVNILGVHYGLAALAFFLNWGFEFFSSPAFPPPTQRRVAYGAEWLFLIACW